MSEDNVLLEVTEIQKSDYSLWNTFVKKSPEGTFFHTTTWADIISNTFGRSYHIILCLKNEQPVGGMVYFSHKKLLWRMITPTAFFPYCAPIFYSPADEQVHKTIYNHLNITASIEKYLRENYDYWVLDVSASSNDIRPYLWEGAVVEPRYNYVVSLKNKEELFENFNQSIRKKVKQAKNQHMGIRESTDTDPLVKLINKSYHRHGMKPVVSEGHLKMFLNSIIDLDQVKLFYLDNNGKITAGRLVVVDEFVAYDLLAGSDDRTGIDTTYLVASILENFAGRVDQFDFLGANHPKIEQFKRGFGGMLVQGFRVTNKIKRPLKWLVKFYTYNLQKKRML